MSVQDHYAQYVTSGGDGPNVLETRAASLGYTDDWRPREIGSDCFVASCGSGCPLRLPGGHANDLLVMDVGCGAGHDVLVAAAKLAKRAVGVDFTRAMIDAAEANLNQNPHLKDRVEFVHANFANDETGKLARYHGKVDLIISNGVFNLCRDKVQAFRAVYHLLKPGGRLVFSDVIKVDTNINATVATSINGDVFSS
jgi:arsenite methyltransferase